MDRRETIMWMLAASAVMRLRLAAGEEPPRTYGTDPDLLHVYHPGEIWPLTLTDLQRKQTALLCDTIVPGAAAVGLVDFIDEWVSAPYPIQRVDCGALLSGLAWIDAEASRRFTQPLLQLDRPELLEILDEICWLPKARPEFQTGARFFARLRDLTVGGYYTTPQGRTELGYLGNTPLPRFDGPPREVLKKAGLV